MGSGDTAPLILNFGPTSRSAVKLTRRQVYRQGKSRRYSMKRKETKWTAARIRTLWKSENLLRLLGISKCLLCCSTLTINEIQTTLFLHILT